MQAADIGSATQGEPVSAMKAWIPLVGGVVASGLLAVAFFTRSDTAEGGRAPDPEGKNESFVHGLVSPEICPDPAL